ncbi:MAG: DEAD/DEAH box helicase [Magnetospirillum sp.]|nr:DEAD/DEAH box helicase [Magnetospirillum sp.]
MTTFSDLGLIEPLVRAVATEGYTTPTPIQAQAIPALIAGRDVLGIAQTGTGKTAAFALPILQHLEGKRLRAAPKRMRALILTPTRELALQIGEGFATYGANLRIRRHVIFGGVGQSPQVAALSGGLDVLVATPGRLLDLISQGHCALDAVEVFVLDEADRMLDMGFIHDVKKIIARLPAKRQTLLFSATMPAAVTGLAQGLLNDCVRVEVTPEATTVERIDQKVLFVDHADKRSLLVDVLKDSAVTRAIVFTRTKHGANRVAEQLQKCGVTADAIHGNKSQNARQRALADFKTGKLSTLVATDIAARGIDVDGVSHVINFDLPNEPESYVHRIGRTARAGADGIALSFCGADEVAYLRLIEKTIRQAIPVETEHRYHADAIAARRAGGGGGSRPPTARPSGSPKPAVGGPPKAAAAKPRPAGVAAGTPATAKVRTGRTPPHTAHHAPNHGPARQQRRQGG